MRTLNIFEGFLSGDPRGFNLIYLVCQEPLINFALCLVTRRDAAEDAVSDAFALLWQKRGTFESELHIKRFLRKVILNKCRTERRTLVRWFTSRTEYMETTDPDASESNFLKELTAHNQWIVDKIAVQMQQLPEQRRQDFQAYFFDLKSLEDIARTRQVALGTVRMNVALATKEIQKYLSDNAYPGFAKKS